MRFSRRSLAVLACAVITSAVLVACAGSTGTIVPSATTSGEPTAAAPSVVGSLGPFLAAECAIADKAFCAPAAAVAEAIVSGDTAAIVEHSRPDVFRCDELDTAIFTDCTSTEVLEGHPIGTAGGNILVYAAPDYGDELVALTAAVDPAFRDDAGSGGSRVLGTSECGPDDPTRRSYYVAWTAALAEGAGDAERVVGLYEFTFRDDAWMIGILYLDTITAWEVNVPDPLRDVACGVTPWGDG